MIRRIFTGAGVLVACTACCLADVTPLFSGWEFQRGENAEWTAVTVPHDWAIGGPFNRTNDLQHTRIIQDGEVVQRAHTGRTGGLPWPGRGRYRRALDIPRGIEHAELVFDGAMSHAIVFADGVEVGRWMNGYNSFRVEIPPTTKMVEVALDNPPASSRWYPGSGLIRPVRLVTGRKTGIETWGNCIRTIALSDKEAKVEVSTRVRGESNGRVVSWTLLAPDGTSEAGAQSVVTGGVATCVLMVEAPRKWSPETPSLYQLQTRLSDADMELDRRMDRVGIRVAGFTREGFFLNGVKRPFRGVCLHHDLGSIGAAFNKSAFRRQVRLLKELGADAIRTAHNMPAADQLDVCDEEGMMVMAESFDQWMTPKTPNDYACEFNEWWRRDLENLLLRHRNHPSVVMWSIGNEINEKDAVAVRDVASQMTDMCHGMDPTRPVVFVTDLPDVYTKSGAIQVTDVPTLTYRLHRYEFMHAHSPVGLVLGGETASTFSSRGSYHFPDEVGVNAEHPDGQASSYDLEHGSWSNLPDDDWAMQDDHAWAIGEFVWTGFDYLGEPTPYKAYWPSRSSYFGIFDLAGLPKDRYWLYRTRWNKREQTLHVLPHWTWPGREGEVTPVYVYTTYPEAELFVNGVSQGRRRRDRNSRLDRYRLRWRDVVYQPGELKVVAFDEAGKPAMEKTVRTAGTPVALRIVAERPEMTATPMRRGEAQDMPDLGYFRVSIVDKDGNVCPDADNRIDVKVSGCAAFRGICNGDATSLEVFTKPTMKAFHGELVVTAEAGSDPGSCRVEVSSPGLGSACSEIPVRASGTKLSVSRPSSGPKVVRVTDRGIVADGRTSQSDAVAELLNSVPDGTEVVFPKGTYYLEKTVTIRRHADLTIRGEEGARIRLHFSPWGPVNENNSAFSVIGSRNVVFENLAITTDNPPNCSGRIVALDPANGTYDVKIDDAFPITGWEHFWGTETFDDEGMPDYALETFEKVTTEEVPDGKGGTRTKMTGTKYEVVGTQLIRVVPPKGKMFDFGRLHVGHPVLYRYLITGATVFDFTDCHDVTLRDIEIERCASIGTTIRPPSSNFTFERYNMRSPEGSSALYCANADGIHIIGLSGSLKMSDCHFNGLGDDCVNIHGKAGEVKSFDGASGNVHCICRNVARQETKLPVGWAKAGDTLVVYDPQTFLEKGTVRLTRYDGVTGRGCLSAGGVPVAVGDILANNKDFASVEIRGCSFRNTRARGLLLQSRDMSIDDCTFEGLALPGILIAPDIRIWNEIGPTVNTVVRNCTFRKCSTHARRTNLGAVSVKASHDAESDDVYPAGVHRDVRIVGNRFVDCGRSGVFVSATTGVTVKDNSFRNCSTLCRGEKDERFQYDVRLHNCSDVDVSGNRTDKPAEYLLDRR